MVRGHGCELKYLVDVSGPGKLGYGTQRMENGLCAASPSSSHNPFHSKSICILFGFNFTLSDRDLCKSLPRPLASRVTNLQCCGTGAICKAVNLEEATWGVSVLVCHLFARCHPYIYTYRCYSSGFMDQSSSSLTRNQSCLKKLFFSRR